jgi:hypothetical protein
MIEGLREVTTAVQVLAVVSLAQLPTLESRILYLIWKIYTEKAASIIKNKIIKKKNQKQHLCSFGFLDLNMLY